jgi:hypothetical protein
MDKKAIIVLLVSLALGSVRLALAAGSASAVSCGAGAEQLRRCQEDASGL